MSTKIKTKRLNIQGPLVPGKVLSVVDDDTIGQVDGGGGWLNVWDLFYNDQNMVLYAYSERKDYYVKYTGSENPATVMNLIITMLNWKWAPIMKNNAILKNTSTNGVSINDSDYYYKLDYIHIDANDAYLFRKKYASYIADSCTWTVVKIAGLDNATPTVSSFTLNLNTTLANKFCAFIWFDWTYIYLRIAGASPTAPVYERYILWPTSIDYYDTWTAPVWLPAIYGIPAPYGAENYNKYSFINPLWFYVGSANVMERYDLVTWLLIDSQFYGNAVMIYNDEVRDNINTSWATNIIFKAFT